MHIYYNTHTYTHTCIYSYTSPIHTYTPTYTTIGLIPAAEPKFKLSNFMKVLGDQAISDPSKVEVRILQYRLYAIIYVIMCHIVVYIYIYIFNIYCGIYTQYTIQARVLQQMRQRVINHEQRNAANKLTASERKAKRERKRQEDTSRQVM